MSTLPATKPSTELATVEPQVTTTTTMGFGDSESFKHLQRVAKVFNSSHLVPDAFRGEPNLGSVIIALNMANRMKADPLAVMQNIYIVYGKPAWAATFVIASVNSCGRFSTLKYAITGTGDAKVCVAWTTDRETGERLESPPVSIEMAKAEGWFVKNGSKWKTMPDLMLRYRSATFFGRLYAPELLMGMRTVDELEDIGQEQAKVREERKLDELKVISGPAVTRDTMVMPEKEPEHAPETISAKDELAAWATSHGVSFDQFRAAIIAADLIPEAVADVWDNYQSIPSKDCEAILKKHKQVLVAFFAKVKGGWK